jgi:proline dehydrogenase
LSLFRDFFLALSKNQTLRDFIVWFPLSRRVARRFVAGDTLDDALRVVKMLNQQGLVVTLDCLGESVTNEAEARAAKDEYLHALEGIRAEKVASHVSVKLTQMGLDLREDLCLDNMREIVAKAKAIGSFARIDMEDSAHTQPTLDVYRHLREEFDNVGIVIQSYLHRSEADIRALAQMGANVRLCKGAYKEPPSVAFPQKKDVDANFQKLVQTFFESDSKAGAHLAVATHDEKMINFAKQYVAAHQIDRRAFEFQMLYGIRGDLQRQLAREGYTMRIYVPYGTHWYPYTMRRMAERPANAIFVIRNILRP